MILLLLAQLTTAPAMSMPAFLSGCWEERRDGGWTEECWTDTRGGLMIGSGRQAAGSRIVHWEWMRIERGADGALTFYASPKGATPVAFKASEATGTSVTFVNASHDYPQRVRYTRTAEGLDAEIALKDGSKPSKWHFRRTAGAPK